MQFHEDLHRKSDEVPSSEREFGLVFASVFAIVGMVQIYRGHAGWGFAGTAMFLFMACCWRSPLRPMNRLWHHFGLLLFQFANPVIMGVVFFTTICPIGLLMRIFGKCPLDLAFDHEAMTYWKLRSTSEKLPQSMKDQF